MRVLSILLLTLGLAVSVHAADAVTGRVHKVLPFLVDQQGRIALSGTGRELAGNDRVRQFYLGAA